MSLENQGIMPKEAKQTQPRTVDVVDPSYQPSRAELREDLRINATFEELAKAVAQPVKPQKKRG